MASNDEKKSALNADENEQLKYKFKIDKNASEDKSFSQEIDAYIQKKLTPDVVLRIGTTPNALKIVGAQSIPLVVTQGVIANSMSGNTPLSNRNREKHTEQHDIPVNEIKSLPKALRNPILVCRGNRANTLVVVTELKNKDNQNIIVPIELSVKGKSGIVNKVSTIHGKKNIQNYLSKIELSGNILAMNKKKADQLYSDNGIQSPTSTTIICFDNSIAYTLQNVKGFEKNSEKNLSQTNEQKTQQAQPAQQPKKRFTISRKKQNENAKKINSKPVEHTNRDKNKKHHRDR